MESTRFTNPINSALAGTTLALSSLSQAEATPVPYIESERLIISCNKTLMSIADSCSDATFESVLGSTWILSGRFSEDRGDGARTFTAQMGDDFYSISSIRNLNSSTALINPGNGNTSEYVADIYPGSFSYDIYAADADFNPKPPFHLNYDSSIAPAVPEPNSLALL